MSERVRRNRFTDEWSEREAELRARREEFAPPSGTPLFEEAPDPEHDQVLYGQGAGFVDAVRPAGDVLRRISAEAEKILRSRPPSLLG